MNAYVINLDHRPERWAGMKVWEEWFTLIRFPAIYIPHQGITSCKLAHSAVALRMRLNGGCVIVLEDDARPTEWFRKIGLRCIQDALDHRQDWDYVNLGPYLDFRGWKGGREPHFEPTQSPLFLHPNYSQQTHFVMYNSRTLPLLDRALKSRAPLDNCLGEFSKDQWVPVRLLATQANLGSDIIPNHNPTSVFYEQSEALLNEAAPNIPIP